MTLHDGFRRRLRFRLILRRVSRPTYYACGLGDEVRLVADVPPEDRR